MCLNSNQWCLKMKHALTLKTSSFVKNTNGSIAIMFVFMLAGILLMVGGAVDMGRAYNAKSDLQNALDAALLAAARDSLKGDIDIQATANNFVKNNWKNKYGGNKFPSVKVSSNDAGIVTGQISYALPTSFLRIAGIKKLKVGANGAVNVGLGEIEIVLALDTTGSMSGTKLDSLKDASNVLIDILMPDGEDYDNVNIGLVPFSQYVNVGLEYRDESWIDVPDDYSIIAINVCSTTYPDATSSNCVSTPSTCSNDGVSYSCSSTSCDWDNGAPVKVCGDQTSNYTWRGCVGSRDHPLNVEDSTPGSPIPGLLNINCASPLTRLTNVKDTITAKISAMNASGNTYIPSGLMWGWRVLSSVAPFDDGVAYGAMAGGETVKKALILMTDGANTTSASYPKHDGSDADDANKITAELCKNIKKTGITIYAITFEVIDQPIKKLMEKCASGKSNYFDADNSTKLNASFEAIGNSLSQLRLTK